MITINDSAETTIIIKKSRFIGFACRIDDAEQAREALAARKSKYHDARHNCFAYVLEDGTMRYSDDGEPQGTAGLPMLEVVKKNGLKDVMVISTRYFGGILLGAGGLMRAYTQSAADTLRATQKVELIPCSVFNCTFSYTTWAKAEKLLKDAGFAIDNAAYASDVTATVSVIAGQEEALKNLVTSISMGQTTPVFLGHHRIEQKLT